MLRLGIFISILSGVTRGSGVPSEEAPLKILFHSTFGGRSHCKGLLEIASDLALRGHNVSYVASSDNIPYANGHDNVNKVNLGHPKYFEKTIKPPLTQILSDYRGTELTRKFENWFAGFMGDIYSRDYIGLINYVDEKKPDIMICDLISAGCQDVAKVRNIPLIIGSQAYDSVGLVSNPYIVKSIEYGQLLIKDLSLFERIRDKLEFIWNTIPHQNRVAEIINLERAKMNITIQGPPMGDLKYGMILSISFVGIEVAQAIPPNVKIVGPLKSSDSTKMSNKVGNFLNTHKAVIYVGFGSLDVLNKHEITCFLSAIIDAMDRGLLDGLIWGLGSTLFEYFPESIIVNSKVYDVTSLLKGDHPNFLILKWAPQPPILNHKSTKLFISHGGLESLFEALEAAVPLLVTPFFFDQPRNARKIEMMGIGKAVLPETITSKKVSKAIDELLLDSQGTYKSNLIRMQSLFRLQSRSPAYASETIENYAYFAKACRPHFPKSVVPCELQHLLPQLPASSLITTGSDVYIALSLATLFILSTSFYIFTKLVKLLFHQPAAKLKKS